MTYKLSVHNYILFAFISSSSMKLYTKHQTPSVHCTDSFNLSHYDFPSNDTAAHEVIYNVDLTTKIFQNIATCEAIYNVSGLVRFLKNDFVSLRFNMFYILSSSLIILQLIS